MMLSALLALLATVPASRAGAYCQLTTDSPDISVRSVGCVETGVGLSWWRTCISYTVVPSDLLGIELDALRNAIDRSFSAWSDVRCGGEPISLMVGQTEELGQCEAPEYNRVGPNANTIAFLDRWTQRGKDYEPDAYALTLVWHDPETGQILDADIQVNLERGTLVLCGDACEGQPFDAVDVQNVITHEAGHFFGLAHSDELEATMYADARPRETKKRTLEVDDIDGLCSIYASAAEKPECSRADFAPRRGFTAACKQPIQSGGCATALARRPAGAVPISVMLGLLLASARMARGRRSRDRAV